MSVHTALAEFPVTLEIPVAWGDMDAFRHVNNTVYLRWFETVRIAYFDRVGWLASTQVGVEDLGVGPILARTSCVYRAPLAYPDTVWVGARSDPPETDRFTMHYCVVSQSLGVVAAQGDGRIISFDYKAGAKVPLPDNVRDAILALEAG